MNTRMQPDDRAGLILDHALSLATETGVQRLTRAAIAKRAGVSEALVSARTGTMAELRRKVYRMGVERECLPVVAEGLAMGVTVCRRAPDSLRRRALSSLID